jgi:hypothetical protein
MQCNIKIVKPIRGPNYVRGAISEVFDVARRHQPYRMTKCLQLARPMVRRGASFDADQALRQLLEKQNDIATLQLAADDYLAGSINSVNLEDRLRNVETSPGKGRSGCARDIGASLQPASR